MLVFTLKCILLDLFRNQNVNIYWFQVSRKCNGDISDGSCDIIPVPIERYYINLITTNTVKILCSTRCTSHPAWVGYREVFIWVIDPV